MSFIISDESDNMPLIYLRRIR